RVYTGAGSWPRGAPHRSGSRSFPGRGSPPPGAARRGLRIISHAAFAGSAERGGHPECLERTGKVKQGNAVIGSDGNAAGVGSWHRFGRFQGIYVIAAKLPESEDSVHRDPTARSDTMNRTIGLFVDGDR